MDNEKLDDLAEQLRATYVRSLTHRQPSSWALLDHDAKEHWRKVVWEAHKWLVG